MPNNDEFAVGMQAVIMRNHRPWKTTRVEGRHGDVVRVDGGFEYNATTGERIDTGNKANTEELVEATPARLAYIEVREFLAGAATVNIRTVSPEEMLRLAELVREFQQITNNGRGE